MNNGIEFVDRLSGGSGGASSIEDSHFLGGTEGGPGDFQKFSPSRDSVNDPAHDLWGSLQFLLKGIDRASASSTISAMGCSAPAAGVGAPHSPPLPKPRITGCSGFKGFKFVKAEIDTLINFLIVTAQAPQGRYFVDFFQDSPNDKLNLSTYFWGDTSEIARGEIPFDSKQIEECDEIISEIQKGVFENYFKIMVSILMNPTHSPYSLLTIVTQPEAYYSRTFRQEQIARAKIKNWGQGSSDPQEEDDVGPVKIANPYDRIWNDHYPRGTFYLVFYPRRASPLPPYPQWVISGQFDYEYGVARLQIDHREGEKASPFNILNLDFPLRGSASAKRIEDYEKFYKMALMIELRVRALHPKRSSAHSYDTKGEAEVSPPAIPLNPSPGFPFFSVTFPFEEL